MVPTMGFEAVDNPSIKRLDMGCETRCEIDESYTFQLINGVACKVVQCESNMMIFHL